MGYYDIDDVLADGVEIPVKFEYDIPGLGYLENNPGQPIRKNAKVKLPLWLSRILAVLGEDSETNEEEEAVPFVGLIPPDMFAAKVINAIKADPVALDIHSINPHFFALAIKWIALFNDKTLAATINDLLLKRAQELNHFASNVASDSKHVIDSNNNATISNFLLTLDEFEKKIYKEAHESYKEAKKWMFDP